MLSFTHNLIDFSATTATIFPILTVLPFVRRLLRQDSWGLWVGLSCMYLCMFAQVWALLSKLISPSQSNIILKITTKHVRFWQLNRLDLHYSFPSRQCCCCPERFVSRVYRVCVCVGGGDQGHAPWMLPWTRAATWQLLIGKVLAWGVFSYDFRRSISVHSDTLYSVYGITKLRTLVCQMHKSLKA